MTSPETQSEGRRVKVLIVATVELAAEEFYDSGASIEEQVQADLTADPAAFWMDQIDDSTMALADDPDAVLDALGLEQVAWLEAPPEGISRGEYSHEDFDPHVSLGGRVCDYGDGPIHATPVYRLRGQQ